MPSLFDLVNQLINEHGSTPILKERLGLIQDKAAEFERKFNLLGAESLVLRKENEKCKAEKTALQKENTDLKEKLEAHNHPVHDNLPKEQQDILILLMNETMKEDKIIAATGRGAGSIRFDLEELKRAGLLDSEVLCGFGPYCSLTQDGRRYLKKNGLLT